jgi:arylsulfatase A-like enzyme
MSDNGWLYGQHRLKSKGYPYEEAVRIPLHVRGPGVAAGRTISTLVGNADLAPTLAAWAGAKVPGDLDGRSLAPLLAGGPGPGRQAISIASQSPYNGVPA